MGKSHTRAWRDCISYIILHRCDEDLTLRKRGALFRVCFGLAVLETTVHQDREDTAMAVGVFAHVVVG